MQGARKLTDSEISLVIPKLNNTRDRTLFVLGILTGFRISELLSIRVSDVIQSGNVLNHLTIARSKMKGRRVSRSVPMHPRAKQAVIEHVQHYGLSDTDYLFFSRKGSVLTKISAIRILKDAFNKAGLTGRLSSHTLRKSFASKVYEASGNDIRAVQKALGHASLSSTSHYLGIESEIVDNIILRLT